MNRKLLLAGIAAFAICSISATPSYADAKFDKQIEDYLATDKGKEQLGKALESYMMAKQANARKQAEDQAEADVERQFKNPVKIDIGKSPVRGPENAKVTIIEFSDFQCPYCSRGKETIDQVMKAYPSDVKVVFKNLPLPFHQQAEPSAKAALAAQKQGKFWEFHDELFGNQGKLSPEFLEETAKKLGLDMDKFKKDMADPAVMAQINEDKALAAKNDIQGTPGFFVNGVAVKGAYPFDHFKMIIDRWLKG
jgi:protein-disulfide isomerase